MAISGRHSLGAGKFPDNSTADALQRVTGVQIRRDADEASVVLVRGLPNVVTLLNGREIFTTTTGVPPAGGRFASLADIPAPLLQRVDAYKSNSPDLVEGGIAGTIDVRLPRDTREYDRTFVVGVRLRL